MKAIMFVTAIMIFLIGGVIFFNEPKTAAQQVRETVDNSVEKGFDERLRSAEVKAALIENIKPPKVIVKTKRVKEFREPTPPALSYVLRVNETMLYEIEPIVYKGNVIIDISLDSLIKDYEIEESLTDHTFYQDTFSQSAIEHADEQIGVWKKFKNMFKKSK